VSNIAQTDARYRTNIRTIMDELDEARLLQSTLSHREILQRFKKLFGRDMAPKERRVFFLPDDSAFEEQFLEAIVQRARAA
jgi:hypothetical protein